MPRIPVLEHGWASAGALGHASSLKEARKVAEDFAATSSRLRGRITKVERASSHDFAPGYAHAYYVHFADAPRRNAPRRNPPLVAFANPRRSVVYKLSSRVYAIQYKHTEDGKDYEHRFGRGVCMELLSDGSIRIYSMNGKRLFGDF